MRCKKISRLALVLKLFSADGLLAIRACRRGDSEAQALGHRQWISPPFRPLPYRRSSRRSLSCRDATPLWRTASAAGEFLPEGRRFKSMEFYLQDGNGDPMAWGFGALGVRTARALGHALPGRYRRSDPRRGRPAFRICPLRRILRRASPPSTRSPARWTAPHNQIDRTLHELTLEVVAANRRWFCLSVPFPARCTPPFASRRPSRRPTRRLSPPSAAVYCQYRAARTERAACLRFLRLRHARCRRAPAASSASSTCKATSESRLARTFVRSRQTRACTTSTS